MHIMLRLYSFCVAFLKLVVVAWLFVSFDCNKWKLAARAKEKKNYSFFDKVYCYISRNLILFSQPPSLPLFFLSVSRHLRPLSNILRLSHATSMLNRVRMRTCEAKRGESINPNALHCFFAAQDDDCETSARNLQLQSNKTVELKRW